MSNFTPNNPSRIPIGASVIDALEVQLFNSKVIVFYPDGLIEVSGCFARRIVQSNSFNAGDFVTLGSPWILADSSFSDRLVHGVIADSNSDEFFISTVGFIELPSHGKGSEGDILWSSTAGGTVTTRPASGTLNFQRVATVVDSNTILLNVEHGVTF